MVAGFPGKSFVFVEFEERGGFFEVAAFAAAALVLEFEQGGESFLKLAREAVGLDAEVREEAMGVDDVEVDGGLLGGRIRGAVEQVGFEERDAVEAPRGVGEF